MVALPSYVQIEPVGQCNLRCQMCAIQFRLHGPPQGPPAFMPFESFTTMVDGFPDLQELHLQGLGEPMMHPRFFDMVRYAVARGIRVTTNSNLTLLNARRAERCVAGAVIARLAVLVTNDSGPAHIAYTLGTPTVTIFGGDPVRYGPPAGPYRALA